MAVLDQTDTVTENMEEDVSQENSEVENVR